MTSGNPAHKPPQKVYVYLVVGMLDVTPEGIDRSGYVPVEDHLPSVGTLLQREDFPGIGTHEFRFEDGPLAFIANAVFVATGEVRAGDEGEQTFFDLGGARVLNLLAFADNAEAVMKQQVHEFADKVLEIVEEAGAGPVEGSKQRVIAGVQKLEKDFWTKK